MPDQPDPKTATETELQDDTAPTVGATRAAMRRAAEAPARVDRYILLDRLGSGGMGVVYAAFDPDLDRKIALKFLHSGELSTSGQARLLREAQAMAQLSHPNVATVFDVGTHDGRVFLAMELVEGTTLKDWLKNKRNWTQIWRVFRQAANGLHAAHEAGIVHRDFKPSNVLIDTKGRAKVTDFGIARALHDAEEDTSDESARTAMAAELTETGAVIGTPGYMAPEQYTANDVDARTDQFAFCTALYEALYGERPFAGRTVPELAEATTTGTVRSARAEAGVPSWRRRILLKGLRTDPDDRYPSMLEIVDALDYDPAARRWKVLGAVAVLALFGGLIALSATALGGDDDPCSVDRSVLGDAWSDARKAALEHAVMATNVPYAGQVWTSLEKQVDKYEAAWLNEHRAVCEATHVRKEQSPEVFDLRMRCLGDRRSQLDAMTELFAAKIEPSELSTLVDTFAKLPRVDGCRDVDTLRAVVPLPEDAAARAKISEVTAALDTVSAEVAAGRWTASRKRLEEIEKSAEATGYAPVQARATYFLGSVHQRLNELDDAEVKLNASVAKAATAGDRLLEAKIWMELVDLLSGTGRLEEGRVAGRAAEAALLRAGSPATLEAYYKDVLGVHEFNSGNLKEALALWTRSSELWLAADGPDSLSYGRSLTKVAIVDAWLGEGARGLPKAKKGLAILERAVGKMHPDVMKAYRAIHTCEIYEGHSAEARDAAQQSVEIAEALFGPDDSQVATSLADLASAYTNLGEFDKAAEASRRALAINLAKFGSTHQNLLSAYSQYGLALFEAGRFADSEKPRRSLVEVGDKVFKDPKHPARGKTRVELAKTLVELGKYEEAEALCRTAAEILAPSPETYMVFRAMLCAARAVFGRGDTKRAITELEAAVTYAGEHEVYWMDTATAHYWLGLALAKAGRDPATVRAQMDAAKALFDKQSADDGTTYDYATSYKRLMKWYAENK